MRKEELSLRHKSILTPRLASLKLSFSEYTFATLFLFRREFAHHVLFDGDQIWVEGKTKDGMTYLMPTEDLRQIPSATLLQKLKLANCFFPIPEEWVSSFDSTLFSSSYNRDDSDYLFKRTKIAEYPGRDLSAKRNLLKQFLDLHTSTVVPYTQDHYHEALYILDEWQKGNKTSDTDYLACKDGLKWAQELELTGYFVYADNKPAAFILGALLNGCSFVVQFAKALREFKGIYPFLFKEMASRLALSQICCLNWEQDLGIEGLRQSKQSYMPDKLAHKIRIFPRKE